MAYKYFTQKLLSSGVDLTTIFPEKQEYARQSNNVSYNLADIALFLKDRTENFSKIEAQYIDLDSALSQIISKYYTSVGEKNPFITEIDDEALKQFESKTPREAVIVEDGKIKGKGAPKAAPDVKKEKKIESKPKDVPKAAPDVKKEKIEAKPKDSAAKKIREEFDSVKENFELFDEAEQNELINDYEIEMSALELLDDDEEAQLRLTILRDEFIPELKRLKA